METQPPTLLIATDCGQWPMVRPCAATACSASNPFLPASKLARRLVSSMNRTVISSDRSSRMASGVGSTPPQTPLPRPKGISAVPVALAATTMDCTSSTVRGRATAAAVAIGWPSQSFSQLSAQRS